MSDHLAAAKRAAWFQSEWPTFLARAGAADGVVVCGDEASFAQWGSLGYTWTPVGQQPSIRTTGKRKAYQVFGVVGLDRGELFYQGVVGKLNSAAYVRFLKLLLWRIRRPVFLVQDGAAKLSKPSLPHTPSV